MQDDHLFYLSKMKNTKWTKANKDELKVIRSLAHEIWPPTFNKILTPEQIAYMLKMMYSVEVLESKFQEGDDFYMLQWNGQFVGFAHVRINSPEKHQLRMHKLYLHPSCQGIGLGRLMLIELENIARMNELRELHLNVNRFNRSVKFYERCGFRVIKEENNDIGGGYLMEDFVMLKAI
jgi:ribosomal protein S18 acetylase RimI-like enzyme